MQYARLLAKRSIKLCYADVDSVRYVGEAVLEAHAVGDIVASIRNGTVVPSHILQKLAAYPRQNGLAQTLREIGRIERTLFILDWLRSPELRHQTQNNLNTWSKPSRKASCKG